LAFTSVFLLAVAVEVVDFIKSNDGYDNAQLGEGAPHPDNVNLNTTPAERSDTALNSLIAGSKKSITWNASSWAANNIGSNTVKWTEADLPAQPFIGEIGLFDSGNFLMARWVPSHSEWKRTIGTNETLCLEINIYVSVAEVDKWS
jgi:hypothetical protein